MIRLYVECASLSKQAALVQEQKSMQCTGAGVSSQKTFTDLPPQAVETADCATSSHT